MRFEKACRCLIKLLVAYLAVVCVMIIGFHNHSQKETNSTIQSTPSPEVVLENYIKDISSWQNSNESMVVNPHPYRYIHVPSGICKSNGAKTDPFVVIVVKSYVSNIGHREAIRATWGKILPTSVKVVFILGSVESMQVYIDIESGRYKDVVQEDFLDVYRNNTVKTIMGFNWVVQTCNQSQYLFFVDDDYIVNVPRLLDYFQHHFKQTKGLGLYSGYRWEKAYPKRSNMSKWYVSEEDYPCQIWPKYVGGGSMAISMDVASKMVRSFKYIKPIFIDDVYIGIVAATLKVVARMEGRFSPDYHPDKIDKLFSTHGYDSSSTLLQDWEKYKHKIKIS